MLIIFNLFWYELCGGGFIDDENKKFSAMCPWKFCLAFILEDNFYAYMRAIQIIHFL